MPNGLKVYRIRIEGFLVEDFGEDTLEPVDWPMHAIVDALGGDLKLDTTLVDTIPWESETEGE